MSAVTKLGQTRSGAYAKSELCPRNVVKETSSSEPEKYEFLSTKIQHLQTQAGSAYAEHPPVCSVDNGHARGKCSRPASRNTICGRDVQEGQYGNLSCLTNAGTVNWVTSGNSLPLTHHLYLTEWLLCCVTGKW